MDIRLEQPGDRFAVEALTREAFWNLHAPGCDEHLLVHKLRTGPDFLPELDFVALEGDRIVGNIMYSRAHIEAKRRLDAALIGPLSVLPDYQNRGVGGALMRHSLQAAREQGFSAVFLYGDPAYYGRFGFRSGRPLGICGEDGGFTDALQYVELVPGALDGVSGRLHEAPAFYDLPEAELAAFDAQFPPKQKRETESQRAFAELVRRLKGEQGTDPAPRETAL